MTPKSNSQFAFALVNLISSPATFLNSGLTAEDLIWLDIIVINLRF